MPFSTSNQYLIARGELPKVTLKPAKVALLVIDMQHYDAHPEGQYVQRFRDRGLSVDYYVDRLKLIVPNIAKLQSAFRENNMDVLFVVIESLTPDGRDRSLPHKNLGHHIEPGSKGAEILWELQPLPGEIVLKKTVSSAFNGTNIDFVLRNMGIDTLVVTGVVTNGCVETSVRDASDLGYEVFLVEDACAAITESNHIHALEALYNAYARIVDTDEIISEVNSRVSTVPLV